MCTVCGGVQGHDVEQVTNIRENTSTPYIGLTHFLKKGKNGEGRTKLISQI